MKNEIKLSVQEILELDHFRQANMVAGRNGRHRAVKWVHVMEVSDVSNLLNGDELILSTGVGWKAGKETLMLLVQQLIDCRAAGLCIELGKYMDEIPEEILELADRHDFPIVVFQEEVRFVDITESVHTLIVKKQYQMIADLEDYSRRINEVLLETEPREKVLRLMHKQIRLPVIYLPREGKPEIVSNKTKREERELFEAVSRNKLGTGYHHARQPIHIWSQSFAELIIVSEKEEMTEFETLILDRTATALAQVILRELWTEERRKAKEADWIQKWLNGEHTEEQVNRFLKEIEPGLKPKRAVVFLLQANKLDTESSSMTYLKMLLQSIFQEQGFFLLSTVSKNEVIFILLDKRKEDTCKQRIQMGIDHIKKSDYIINYSSVPVKISAGTIVDKLTQVKRSYEKAKIAAAIKEKISHRIPGYFYEDLHIYRLIYAVQEQGMLHEFVADYLRPVLAYDSFQQAKLMNTLKIYLECNGSKKETAERLYIVRQTLYHRLEKLYELLGEDFMEPPKRQAIEFAVAAYEYLETVNQEA
ncbi:PucR family transcriptional regulator ligand-binding domain-containing protein [Pseudobacillus sp. FSL P4-0506]|uniref:PucR family transcriptional regulator n=1 Tax=unclassified Pseudobacillus TaxID=2619284 RepID=UPI0030F8C2E5